MEQVDDHRCVAGRLGLVETRMRWKPHVRFGGRAGATNRWKQRCGAPARSHLANQVVTKCRQRVQQATLEHRGWKGDPLCDVRKLLLLGAERVDANGWARLHAAFTAGDPTDAVSDCWTGTEKVRAVYLTNDVDEATVLLDDAIAWCAAPESGPELRTLGKALGRWRGAILAHHTTGASNGPVEAPVIDSRHGGRRRRQIARLTHGRPAWSREVAACLLGARWGR